MGPRLLLITNRKWHTSFQIRRKSLILDDFEGCQQPVWLAMLVKAGFLVIDDYSSLFVVLELWKYFEK